MKPQAKAVLGLLRGHPEGITALMALDEAQTFRLAARVGELRSEGYAVDTEWVTTPAGARIARYRLLEPAGQLEAFR